MEFMPWKTEYILGFKSIDLQHQKLVSLINSLYKNMIKVGSEYTTQEIIKELIQYTMIHFKHEEDIFDNINYPHTDQHKLEHQKFCDQISKFSQGQKIIESEILVLLKDWLRDHILSSDKLYIEHFIKSGIK